MRILVAGIVGGIVMFMWGAVSHMVFGIGEMGFKTIPNEISVVSNLKSNITEPGMYFVPGLDLTRPQSAEEEAAWTEKYKEGPNAIIIYNPTGITPLSAGQLLIELVSCIAAAIVVAFCFTWLVPSFVKRVALAGLIGFTAWLSIDVSYWDWYRFPSEFIAGELIEQVVGWLLVGFVMALIVWSRPVPTAPTPAP
jgi:hypothetical protein